MNLDAQLLAERHAWLLWVFWLMWLPVLTFTVRYAPWARLLEPEGRRLNLWLGVIVSLLFFWRLAAGVKPGLDLHLTGVMLFFLLFGARLAFLGLNLLLLGLFLSGGMAWQSLAPNAIVTAGLGVLLAVLIRKAVERWLPRHFFIFIFLQCFFGAAAVVMGVGLAATLLYAAADAYSLAYLLEFYLPYYLLLGFSEAWISGAILTVLAVYRPHWVDAYDPRVYLDGK
ncbi:MAG: energy-coupling factor ABC transporter permease [Zoogloeaceae bacterium]|jgi:uncharacterized membrane protein|nr:energy-coupling factor ABC transporter permease [Zoogloeaceae bacterium]